LKKIGRITKNFWVSRKLESFFVLRRGSNDENSQIMIVEKTIDFLIGLLMIEICSAYLKLNLSLTCV